MDSVVSLTSFLPPSHVSGHLCCRPLINTAGMKLAVLYYHKSQDVDLLKKVAAHVMVGVTRMMAVKMLRMMGMMDACMMAAIGVMAVHMTVHMAVHMAVRMTFGRNWRCWH